MKKNYYTRITIILFIIGLMMTVLYNTVSDPKERDTRDVWAIREELAEEKKRHSDLLEEIRTLNEVMKRYEEITQSTPEVVLKQTIEELETKVGLRRYEGPGLTLTIMPSNEAKATGKPLKPIPPGLLIQLTNQLYEYKAIAIEIDNKRLTQKSAIRDVNGKTSINSEAITMPPFDIKVATTTIEDASKLQSQLLGSSIVDYFYLDDLLLKVEEVQANIQLSPSEQPFQIKYLQEVNERD